MPGPRRHRESYYVSTRLITRKNTHKERNETKESSLHGRTTKTFLCRRDSTACRRDYRSRKRDTGPPSLNSGSRKGRYRLAGVLVGSYLHTKKRIRKQHKHAYTSQKKRASKQTGIRGTHCRGFLGRAARCEVYKGGRTFAREPSCASSRHPRKSSAAYRRPAVYKLKARP